MVVLMAKCPTCKAPVNLAPDGDPKYEPPHGDAALVKHLTDALTLIERLYYTEGKDAQWRAAHMNGVARDAQNGASIAWDREYPLTGMAAEAFAQRNHPDNT